MSAVRAYPLPAATVIIRPNQLKPMARFIRYVLTDSFLDRRHRFNRGGQWRHKTRVTITPQHSSYLAQWIPVVLLPECSP